MHKSKFSKYSLAGDQKGHLNIYWLRSPITELCAVCGEEAYGYAFRDVLIQDTIIEGRWIYIVPASHEACRELVLLNPLGYLDGK